MGTQIHMQACRQTSDCRVLADAPKRTCIHAYIYDPTYIYTYVDITKHVETAYAHVRDAQQSLRHHDLQR